MKSLVIYYSHTGNTANVVKSFAAALRKMGEVDIFELEYSHGKRNLLQRLLYRLMPFLVRLNLVPLDLKDYDVLCLGIPVLFGYPPPAVSKYISISKNMAKKKIICCYVYGVEASAKNCSRYVEKILARKGRPEITSVFVSWVNAYNVEFLDNLINETMRKIA